MEIKDSGFYVDFISGYFLCLRISGLRHKDGTCTWVVHKPGEDKEISVHTNKRDAMDAAMARITTWKLQGKLE